MPIITLSRGTMSGGKELAECIAGSLNIPCIGREILIPAAAKLGVPEDVLAKKMEMLPKSVFHPNFYKMVTYMQKAVRKYAG